MRRPVRMAMALVCGIRIDFPRDTVDVRGGFRVRKNFLGNPILGLPDRGAPSRPTTTGKNRPTPGCEAAAARVGAFPLQEGSADAALPLTLAPGVCPAQGSGAAGAPGIALIEIHRVPEDA